MKNPKAMKTSILILVIVGTLVIFYYDVNAKVVYKVIDKGINNVEQGLKNVFKKKDKKDQSESKASETKKAQTETDQSASADKISSGDNKPETIGTGSETALKEAILLWNKYDFVPGDAVIFEDNLQNEENGDLKLSVEGHTDSQSDDALNMKLSQERAETVMNTLIKMGISADWLSAKGWGESKPISNNASPEEMAITEELNLSRSKN